MNSDRFFASAVEEQLKVTGTTEGDANIYMSFERDIACFLSGGLIEPCAQRWPRKIPALIRGLPHGIAVSVVGVALAGDLERKPLHISEGEIPLRARAAFFDN